MRKVKVILFGLIFLSAFTLASCCSSDKKEKCCKEGEKKECCEKKDSTKCCEKNDSTKCDKHCEKHAADSVKAE